MGFRPGVTLSVVVALWLLLTPLLSGTSLASSPQQLSKGQTVYVPVYSNVFSGPKALPFHLATTLSIRSTEMSQPLSVTAIDYYDTNGRLVRRHLAKPQVVNPLATIYVHLDEKDTAGGFGANFIVSWQAGRTINAPIIECVMIGATSGQGISFVSPGQVIREETR